MEMMRATFLSVALFGQIMHCGLAVAAPASRMAYGFESPVCGGFVSGAPGSTVRVHVTANLDVDVDGVSGWLLGIDVAGPGARVGLESCDDVCASAILFPGGDGGEVFFSFVELVDPQRMPDHGPLAGTVQGEGIVSAIALRSMPDVTTLPPGRHRLVHFFVDVVVPRDDLDVSGVSISYVDGKLGSNPGAVENSLTQSARTVLPTELDSCFFVVVPETDVDVLSPRFVRGDVDANGVFEIADPIANLAFQFLGTFLPPCVDACDFDDNCRVEIADPIANLTYQFLGGLPPAAPGDGACARDSTEDELDCEDIAECQ